MKLSTYIEQHMPMTYAATRDFKEATADIPYPINIGYSMGKLIAIYAGHLSLVRNIEDTKYSISMIVPDGFDDHTNTIRYESDDLTETLNEFVRLLKERGL
jgi:hypothetical protein